VVGPLRLEVENDGKASGGVANDAGLLAHAAQALLSHRRAVLVIWVQRLDQCFPQRRWPALRLPDVLGDVPALLDAVQAALCPGRADLRATFSPELAERVHRQTTVRLAQGAPLDAILNEQALLRDEVWMLFRRCLPAEGSPAELLALARALDGALQRVLEVCILAGGVQGMEERAA
jgi:hypothetical protein